MADLDAADVPHYARVFEYRLEARIEGGEARWLLSEKRGGAWSRVAAWATAVPPNGYYEEAGLARLRALGVEPNFAVVHLALPDGERVWEPGPAQAF